MRPARGLLFVLVWLAMLDFPHQDAADGLDASWVLCLGHFLKHRYQCGVDYLWTYGPLGFFVHSIYDNDLFWYKCAWELIVKFIFTWTLLRWADLMRSGWMRALFLGVVLIFLTGTVDALYLFVLVLFGLLPLRDERCRTWGHLAIGTILLAVLALTKFTFLLVAVAVWFVVLTASALDNRRRAGWVLGFPAVAALLWLFLGQSLGNVRAFLSGSLELARGYGEAMASDGSPGELRWALAGMAVFLTLPLLYPRSLLRRDNLLGMALVSASLVLVFKHGFIRQGSHVKHFFNYLLVVPFAVEGLLGVKDAQPNSLLTAYGRDGWVAVLLVLGAWGRGPLPSVDAWLNRLYANAADICAPMRLRHSLDAQHDAQVAAWELPAIRRLVERNPVDQISTAQGVLLLNRLEYQPRPVFQSYSAYVPRLLARNADFYRSERAPAFVLWKLAPIDDHFPAMEDGQALLEILHRYRPVLREKGFLLLKRHAESESSHSVLLERTIGFDEEVRVDDLGAMPKSLSLLVEDTLRGWLMKTLFRPPPLFLGLRTRDGETHSYRLIPAMAGSDFLLDPLLRDDADVQALYAGRPLPRVVTFSVHGGPEARACYRDRMGIVVRSEEGLMEGDVP